MSIKAGTDNLMRNGITVKAANGSSRISPENMKNMFIIFILMAYICASTVNTKTLEIKAVKPNMNELVKRITKEIKYEVDPRAIAFSSISSLIEVVKMKLNDFRAWIASKENTNTFIGRCFGVARGIRVAMPLIMIKLGVIVTILIFLTLFSLKTLALVLFSVLFSAGNVIGKFTSWKSHTSQSQRPQNIHFHVYQSRKNVNGQLFSHSQDRNSVENFSANMVENEPIYPEETENQNLMSLYQQGFYHAYSTQPSIEPNLDSRMAAFDI